MSKIDIKNWLLSYRNTGLAVIITILIIVIIYLILNNSPLTTMGGL